jgi:hypothetical protein
MHARVQYKNLKGRSNLQNQRAAEKTILKWIQKTNVRKRTGFIEFTNVIAVTKLQFL